MRALTAAQLLAVWEQGADQPLVRRALLLLAAACEDESAAALAGLSIGARDMRLLALREWTFGASLTSVTDCPACKERLELTFQTRDLQTIPDALPAEAEKALTYTQDGYRVVYRLPNSQDLIWAAESPSVAAGRQALIERCLAEVDYQGQPVPVSALPDTVLKGVIGAMRNADPQADIRIDLHCPACGHDWQAPFDILAYFWNEIEAWAYRTLQEIHRLALAYGWSETEILALSARRRQMYLAMI